MNIWIMKYINKILEFAADKIVGYVCFTIMFIRNVQIYQNWLLLFNTD